MSDPIKYFKDLIIWQKAMAFAEEVHRLTARFPSEEKYSLTNQLRRAVVSVPSNISEGHARQGNEFLYFLSVARGSLAEAETQLLLAVRFGYLTERSIANAEGLIMEIRKMASALTGRIIDYRASHDQRQP